MIFNDQMFESYEAQQEFYELTKNLSAARVEQLRSVLGKPSQFVGCPKTYHQAVEHWRLWQEFMDNDQAEFDRQMAEIRQEDQAVQKRRGRPPNPLKDVEVHVPRDPSEPRGRGRPRIAPGTDRKALKEAHDLWNKRRVELNDFARECNAWLMSQINAMKAQIQEQVDARQVLVNEARAEYEKLRDGSG
jgi:hypothetical protein